MLAELPLECVAGGVGWVVLQHGLKLTSRCTGSEAFLGGARSVTSCALFGATWLEIQSYVQTAAAYAMLGCAQKRPSCESRLASASAWPGAT